MSGPHSPGPSVAAYLRQATRQEHRLTEKTLSSGKMMRSELSQLEYNCLLQTNHEIWASAAENLFSGDMAVLSEYLPLATRLEEAAAHDLTQLGVLESFTQFHFSPPMPPGYRWGIAYVLLGSGLGAGMLLPRLQKCPELSGLDVFRFYSNSGSLTMADWRVFQQRIDQAVTDDTAIGEAVAGAIHAFGLFQSVYRATALK